MANKTFKATQLYAHPFAKDGKTHVVFTARPKVSRRGDHRVLCGLKLDTTFQRRGPSLHRAGLTGATCDGCVASLTGAFEALQKPAHTKGANQFG